jgi:transcriptional regulator with XRE-family HTH domain
MEWPIITASELGKALRAERKAQGKTQAQIARMIGCRRQAIGDVEAGRNVESYTIFSILAALGKGLQVVQLEMPTVDDLESLFAEDD